jgi:hypothetical protein
METRSYLNDKLLVVTSKEPCKVCGGGRRERRSCQACKESGFTPISLKGLWWPQAGFLVCGGPSLNKMPYQKLSERGIVSLAVNNASGYVPVTAWCFSDPQHKFHHGAHLDPKCITFSPIPKLRKHIYVKLPDGTFRSTDIRVADCPGVFGFARTTTFDNDTFLTSEQAYWGYGGKDSDRPFTVLETMFLGLRLMHYLGCPRVYMIGVDHYMDEKAQYAFNQTKNPHNGRYRKVNEMLVNLRKVFEKSGFFVYNCNPESRCTAFDYVPFDMAFQDCKGGVPKEPFDLSKWYNKSTAEEDIKRNPTPLTIDDLRRVAIPPPGLKMAGRPEDQKSPSNTQT